MDYRVVTLCHEGYGWWHGGAWIVVKNLLEVYNRRGMSVEHRMLNPGGLVDSKDCAGVYVRRYMPRQLPKLTAEREQILLELERRVLDETIAIARERKVSSETAESIRDFKDFISGLKYRDFASSLKELESMGVHRMVLDALYFSASMTDELLHDALVHGNLRYVGLASAAAHMMGYPVVFTPHALELVRPWRKDSLGELGYIMSAAVEKVTLGEVDAVVCVSKSAASEAGKYYRVSPNILHSIPDAVNTKKFKPASNKKIDEICTRFKIKRPYVLFVGKPSKQKGLKYLIKAAPDINVETIVLCLGRPDRSSRLLDVEELVGEAGAERFTIIHEILHHNDLSALYSGAKVACHPSLWESYGLVHLEAAACGTPVVATETGILPELKPTWFTLVPFQDPEAISREVNKISADEKHRAKMSLKARQVAEGFTWEKTADSYMALYEDVVKKRRA